MSDILVDMRPATEMATVRWALSLAHLDPSANESRAFDDALWYCLDAPAMIPTGADVSRSLHSTRVGRHSIYTLRDK